MDTQEFISEDTLTAKIITMVCLFAVSMGVGLIPLLISLKFDWFTKKTNGDIRTNNRLVMGLLAFGGGVLFSTTFMHLLHEVDENIDILQESPFLTIIVTSYVGHVELRSAHRRAMPPDLLKSMNITRAFLLSKIPSDERYITQAAIINEHSIFDDILQGSFVENYRNLTLKHLMGLRWASSVCRPTYILKVDDDTVFNLESTYKLLLSLGIRETLLMGYMLNNTVPRRDKQNKWYVTQEEYAPDIYPTYLSGWYYITTTSVATKLCDEALYHPNFWIDDIYITGILAKKIEVQHTQVPKDYWLEYYELLECCISDMIKKSIRCNYVVGPNGGRNNLIVEFNEALRLCNKQKKCVAHSISRPLKKVCVVNRERDIFSNGQGEVQLLKH